MKIAIIASLIMFSLKVEILTILVLCAWVFWAVFKLFEAVAEHGNI